MVTNPKLSFAGTWHYADDPGADIVSFYAQAALGLGQLNGVVLAGWSYGSFADETFRQTNVAVFDQNADGSLNLSTSRYIQNPKINGAGSVLVDDFNADGLLDIFLAAYGEAPFVLKPSTAYLSQSDGSYQILSLNDTTNAHSTNVGLLNGIKTIVTAGYMSVDPLFQFNFATNNFNVLSWGNDWIYQGENIKSYYAATSLVGDFDGDGFSELVLGDDTFAGNNGFDPEGHRFLTVYKLDGTTPESIPAFKTWLASNPDPAYQTYLKSINGWEHTYRIWADDFNHDQQLDILAGVGPWSAEVLQHSSQLVLMQNQGGLNFVNKTASLASAYSPRSNTVDGSMQLIDIDQSGINSYMLGDMGSEDLSTNSNYLLINDGTGKLYAALHDEFINWGNQVKLFLDSIGASYNESSESPRFIGFITKDGTINYLAQWLGDGQGDIPFVNVPIRYNVTTDFKEDVTVGDRNQSMLVRTWAGNDTFHEVNTNSKTHIDGGLGHDVCVYTGTHDSYAITFRNNETFITKQVDTRIVHELEDTLVNIERLEFSDTMVGLDVGAGGHTGEVYRLYLTVLGRNPEADSVGCGFWIDKLDQGILTTEQMVGYFLDSYEFVTRYGDSTTTNDSFVNLMYLNLLGRDGHPDSGFDFWRSVFENNSASREQVVVGFMESPENVANAAPLIGDAPTYQQWIE